MTIKPDTINNEQIGQLVVLLLTFLGAGWKWVLPKIMELSAIVKSLPTLHANMAAIQTEFKPNGGSTIKDALDRIEAAQATKLAIDYAIWRNSDQAAFRASAGGMVTNVTRQMVELLERSDEDLMGSGWINAIVQADRGEVFDEFHSCLTGPRVFDMTVKIFVSSSNKTIDVHVRVEPVLVNDKVVSWVGILNKRN